MGTVSRSMAGNEVGHQQRVSQISMNMGEPGPLSSNAVSSKLKKKQPAKNDEYNSDVDIKKGMATLDLETEDINASGAIKNEPESPTKHVDLEEDYSDDYEEDQ